ncbi:Uncharacterised protein [Bordetella pertussis]|nr:Uncharacterised protein [Bordetella pertussis]
MPRARSAPIAAGAMPSSDCSTSSVCSPRQGAALP